MKIVIWLNVEYADFLDSSGFLPDANGCPKNTRLHYRGENEEYMTCSCEEHCSWDLCRLEEAPEACLQGTARQWVWNPIKNAWATQIKHCNKIFSVILWT